MSHIFVNGRCRCLGPSTSHNEDGEIYVYSRADPNELVDYFKDMAEYYIYNTHLDRRHRIPVELKKK